MGSISAGDLALLREKRNPQYTVETLYMWGYPTMWKGRVNDASPTRGMQTIAYDGGAMETDFVFAELTNGLLVFFGSSEGARDYGDRMLLSITGTATSGSIIVDWHDDMELVDDAYISIILLRLPFPRFSWFSQADGFYKDGPPASEGGAGINYTDQNVTPPPHVVIGRPAIVTQSSLDMWWLADSAIAESQVVAAYQPVGAIDQANSYINLANPGTFDLGVGVAPTWAVATGWDFNGTTQYLTTGITPSKDWTIAIRIQSDGTTVQRTGIGCNPSNAQFGLGTTDILAIEGWQARWGNSADLISFPIVVPPRTDTLVLSGSKFYHQGSFISDLADSSTFTGTPVSMYIGASNDGVSANDFYDDQILAIAIYNGVLTASQISALTTRMNAIDENTENGIALDATDSEVVDRDATISTYSWAIVPDKGFIYDSTSSSTRVVLPSGKFYVSCAITDSNGKESTGYRPIIMDDGTFGITEFSRTALTESYNQHLINCSITLTNPSTTWTDIARLGMLFITADDYYDTTQKTITFRDDTRYTDRERLLYWGFLTGEKWNLSENGQSKIVLGATSIFDVFIYSLSLTGVRTSSDWYEMASALMNISSLVYHLFRWHSTLLEISDWLFDWSDAVLRSAVEEWTEGLIFGRGKGLADQHGRLWSLTSTTQGEFFLQSDINYRSEADRNSATTTLTLDNDDLEGQFEVTKAYIPSIGQLYLSGGLSQGVMRTFEPFLSVSQTTRKLLGSNAQTFERLMLASQTEANRLSGRILSVANREVSIANMAFSGIYREVFSPANQQWTNTGSEVFSGSTYIRGTTDLNNLRMVPRQITKNPPTNGYGTVTVLFDFEAPAGELTGRTITPPNLDPNYVPPDIDITPPIIDEPPDALVSGDDTNGVEVYIFDNSSWESRNTGLSGSSLIVNDVKVVPYWWILQNSTDPEDCIFIIATDGGVYRTIDFGKSYRNITPLEDLDDAPTGVTPSTVTWYSVDVFSSVTDIGRIITLMCREDVAGVTHSWLLVSTNGGYNWTSEKHE